MEKLLVLWDGAFLDALFYVLTAVVFLIGVVKCVVPVLKNASRLERAAELLSEGANAKLSRPVWQDARFLGKKLQDVWQAFLNCVSTVGPGAQACDVSDYVNEETVIDTPGRAGLADLVPGFCTSLGILGTFVGLTLGLSKVDMMDTASYVELTNGIALAFKTSIVGVIGSLVFSFLHRYAIGRAKRAMDRFSSAFYAYGLPKPAETGAQLLAYQREQADALTHFNRELGERLAGEIYQAVASALQPMQQTMDRYMSLSTRAQIEGLDMIVGRFIERMDSVLSGQLRNLSATISHLVATQENSSAAVEKSGAVLAELAGAMERLQKETTETLERFSGLAKAVEQANQQIDRTQTDTVALLDEVADASAKQSRYLSALQDYQKKLQASFQDYTVWTDKFASVMEDKTTAQNEALEQIAADMRASSELLNGAYKSFVESIEVGLANALGLFDENMQNLVRQMNGALGEIHKTMHALETSLRRAGPKLQENEREVS